MAQTQLCDSCVCCFTVGSLNNNSTVMGKAHAWRLLGCLPILKRASLLRGTDYARRWQQLFYDCLKMVFEEVNKLCSAKSYLRFGDGLFRLGQPFLHFFSVDGEEVACQFSSTTRDCPVCKCPHDKLDSTTEIYPMCLTEELCTAVAKAQEELLN